MRILGSITAGLVLVMSAAAPAAAQFVFACPATCNVDCQMVTDIACGPGQGVVLNNGVDLDMKGFNISCAGPSSCGTAVTMTAANSIVKSSGTGPLGDPEPRITGHFALGVNCTSKTNSRVEGIRFEIAEDHAGNTTDVYNCAKVENNVLIGGDFGIDTSGIANTDLIKDNWVADFDTAIRVMGPRNVTVEHNVVVGRAATGSDVGIYILNATGAPVVTNNVVMGDGGVPIGQADSPGATYVENFCAPNLAGASLCTMPIVPFVFP